MPRPQKSRRICSKPKSCKFLSETKEEDMILLQMDEYEAVRLLDYEGMTQVQCANQMNVARATITIIYENARKKIAKALVEGKSISIEGGNVEFCKDAASCCGRCGNANCSQCIKNCNRKEEKNEHSSNI